MNRRAQAQTERPVPRVQRRTDDNQEGVRHREAADEPDAPQRDEEAAGHTVRHGLQPHRAGERGQAGVSELEG